MLCRPVERRPARHLHRRSRCGFTPGADADIWLLTLSVAEALASWVAGEPVLSLVNPWEAAPYSSTWVSGVKCADMTDADLATRRLRPEPGAASFAPKTDARKDFGSYLKGIKAGSLTGSPRPQIEPVSAVAGGECSCSSDRRWRAG